MTYSGGFPEEGYNQAVDAFFRETLDLLVAGGLNAQIVSAHATVYILRDEWPYGITETPPGNVRLLRSHEGTPESCHA